MADRIEIGWLFDFYGPLLTERQRKLLALYCNEDFSLSEIAAREGISRQGVHDLIKRCDKILRDYEDKLHLVERFMQTKKDVELIKKYSNECKVNNNLKEIDEIISISDKILSEI